ncbi:dephospho-CoA kinase [Ekhidna sp.]|uniref:dephospho-CoA kinase n=1 Tax=Ekhidna sp. TaxID=2608089 RepID=UPI003B509B9E
MPGKQLFIGITGGIGSGKTTVCKIFEVLGAKTYYADERAKALMESDQELISEIKSMFGDEAYSDGKLDRKYIAKRAFNDQSLLERLNNLVHPAVGRDVSVWKKQQSDSPFLLKEAALLFETGSYKLLDKNILITAPEDLRIKRVIKRDSHRTESDIKAIIQKQMSDDDKIPLADFVIDNGEDSSLIKQVMKVHQSIIA